jgi:hypothetical protein
MVGFRKQVDGRLDQHKRLQGVAKAKLPSNKTQVFLVAAKGHKEVEDRTQGCWGRIPTLGRVPMGLNLIHGPLGQNRVTQHRRLKRTL